MRLDLRWQLLLAAICLGLVASLLGFQLQTTGLCTTQVPSSGGRLTEGIIGRPERINPIFSDTNPVEQDLVDLVFDGLTRFGDGGQVKPSLARSWEFSEDGRTVTFELRDDARWHDGTLLSAEDVVFSYGLLQNQQLPAPQHQKTFWQSISISQITGSRIQFILPQAYSPILEAVTRGVLPSHVLAEVPAEELYDHIFNLEPIGTGPFLVVPGNDWRRTGVLRLAPNPNHWRSGTMLDGLEFRFYPDGNAVAEAFGKGEIQAINSVPAEAIRELATLPGIHLYSAGTSRLTQVLFNLGELGAQSLRDVNVRKALAYALDRKAIVDQALNGQGLPLNGPYLPDSWAYRPDLSTNYEYMPDRTAGMLDEAGWTLTDGSSIRTTDTQIFSLRLVTSDQAEHLHQAKIIAQLWLNIGVQTEIFSLEPSILLDRLGSGNFDIALVDVDTPSDPDLYDFWSQEAIIRGQNFGRWNNRWASEALESARKIQIESERKLFYEAFLKFYDEDLPALTLYQHVYTYGISDTVKETEIGKIDTARDRYKTMDRWFLIYREIAITCPEDGQ